MKKWLPAVSLALLASAVPSHVEASGITLGRFGGVYGHPNAAGGLALYWNPALLAAETGGFVSLDGTLAIRRAAYTRELVDSNPNYDAEGVQEWNTGRATTSTIAVLPYAAGGGAFNIGSGLQLGLAAGVYPQYGGSVEWDKALDAPSEYPGAVDGPQRWASIASQLLTIHYSGGVGISLPELGISIGGTVSYVDASIDTTRARNANREEELVDSLGNLQEGRVWLEAEDTAITGTVGASYETGRVRLSAVYRAAYSVRLEGPLTQAFATQPPGPVDSFIEINFPHVFQTGVQVQLDRVELTATTDFSTWSRMEDTDLLTDTERPEMLLAIPRNLDNTLSVRGTIGGNITERVHLTGMIGLDPSAVPEETQEPGLNDAMKFNLGLGARILAGGNTHVLISYVEDLYLPVEVDESIHEPATNGRYVDSRRWLNVSLDARF
jgi:long-chain fatty acid transport protein